MSNHLYLWVCGLGLLAIFLTYVFICEHRVPISDNEMWSGMFQKAGFTPDDVPKITHDDSMWYFNDIPTCVGYSGDFEKVCHQHEHYCSGRKVFGNALSQAINVKKAVNNGGEHPDCPLIYQGTD